MLSKLPGTFNVTLQTSLLVILNCHEVLIVECRMGGREGDGGREEERGGGGGEDERMF